MKPRGLGGLLRDRPIAVRLLASAAFWSVAILLTAGVALSTLYRLRAEGEFDQRLGVYLTALLADVASPGEETHAAPGELGEPLFEILLSGWYWQITRLDGEAHAIRTSRSLFASRLPRLSDQNLPADFGAARRGYVIGPDKQPLRMVEREIIVDDAGAFLVQVAATTRDLDAQIASFQLALALTFALLALALVGSSALQVRFGLAPLRRLRQGVADIRRGEADRMPQDFPRDVAPLAAELNLLLDANRAIVERARTQVGNLAHALKTPLAVITNENEGDAAQFAAKVREQARLMRDQVTYYLDRARVAARGGSLGGSALEVEPPLAALARTFGKIYADKRVILSPMPPEGMKFAGERQDFEEMIGNLVDNACKWAASEARVTLERETAAAFCALIDDDGPGLPEGLRAAVMARGKRLDESKPGSGLGLSIVADLAELYGGALTLEQSPLGGLRARLSLPLA